MKNISGNSRFIGFLDECGDHSLEIIDRLYNPQHPVRNRLETPDSVEVVRTVREALK